MKKLSPEEQTIRNRFILLAVLIGVLGAIVYLFLTYEPKSVAQKFYEDRQNARDYYQGKDNESAKKRAERNIFLQD
ncbi:MAG: hypothetical protein V7785_03360 [Bermanella sp.]